MAFGVRSITRREALLAGCAIVISSTLPASGQAKAQWKPLLGRLAELEKKSGGRLGCALLDTATDQRFGHRNMERFPMCSTFKLLAVGLALHRVDQGEEQLGRRIFFSPQDLLPYAPITKDHAGGSGMTVAELCSAAITLSDNTAANLLLASFGGPQAVTAFARSMGDSITRLDRNEPTLNEATPGDPRDTTAPSMMLENLRKLLLGDTLQPASRDLLTNWLVACQTGTARLRGGLPESWKAGDKTGSGDRNTSNDIAILWPPNRAPILVTAYLTESTLDADGRNAILAQIGSEIGSAVASTLGAA
jgi:beta-lactamase class A